MEASPNRLAAGGLVAALVLTLLFAFSHVGARHDPQPHHMPIGVIDARSAAAVASSNGKFVPPRLLIASAGSYAATQYAAAAFTRAQPRLRVVDFAPLPQGDSHGLALFYLAVALIFGGYLGSTVVTTLVGPRSSSHRGAALRLGGPLVLLALYVVGGTAVTLALAARRGAHAPEVEIATAAAAA